jgi:DNA-binding IclR family transcriptional regulator
MTRLSPGIGRMVAILDFFADHPGQHFTLTQLARALKLSRATCHAILAALVDRGYLYRTHDKSYVIGQRLVAIGRIANEYFSPLQVAEPEMRALADEFDAVCAAFFREGEEVVARAREASLSQLGGVMPKGARMRIWPPLGAIYHGGLSSTKRDACLDRTSHPLTPEQRTAMLGGLAFMWEHGFLFGVRNIDVLLPKDAPEQAYSGQFGDYPMTVESAIRLEDRYRLAYVIAPIFDFREDVAFTLALTGFTGLFPGARVERMGRRLREACDRVSNFSGQSHR